MANAIVTVAVKIPFVRMVTTFGTTMIRFETQIQGYQQGHRGASIGRVWYVDLAPGHSVS
jgi:hypothetical protein